MFSVTWRFFRYAVGLLAVALIGLVLATVRFQPPTLPSTSLGTLEARTYYLTVRELSQSSTGQPTEIVLSPTETSYLLEQYQPEVQQYGLELADVHLEAGGSLARLRAVFEAPMGLYLPVDFRGTVERGDDVWQVTVESLWLGSVPVTWVSMGTWSVNGPGEVAGGRLEIREATVDGQGLRAVVVNRGLDFDLPVNLMEQFTTP